MEAPDSIENPSRWASSCGARLGSPALHGTFRGRERAGGREGEEWRGGEGERRGRWGVEGERRGGGKDGGREETRGGVGRGGDSSQGQLPHSSLQETQWREA